MHCSANVDDDGRVAVFFGLSGTGKTTLSADPQRRLIGDDEHGWGDRGVFNIEGGCYAKVIRLSADAEPEICKTTRTFGTILENVAIDERGVLDLDDDSKTENTRAAYKLEQISNALPEKRAGHPSAIVMLTADAFGILPPIARLTRAQALFYFLSGFTAKLAGTEIGVTEPQPTFSTCFGAPFLPQPPHVYARMLGEKLDAHDATAWLVNTGWTGGPFGEGERMPIGATRALLHAALSGRARRRRVPDGRACSGSRCRPRCRASTRSCSTRARRGATRPRTTRRRASSRRCSATNFEKFAAGCAARGRGGRPARLAERRGAPHRAAHSIAWTRDGSEARRARRRRRLRRHARRDRGVRRGRRRGAPLEDPSDAQPLRRRRGRDQRRARERVRGRPRERTPSTPSRAPTTSATRTRSRSSATRRPTTSTSSSTGAPSSRAPRTGGSRSARSAPRERRAPRTPPTSPATCSSTCSTSR